MYRPLIRSCLLLSSLLTIPFSQLKNQAAVRAALQGTACSAASRTSQDRSITVSGRSTDRQPWIMNDDSAMVDHIIELY